MTASEAFALLEVAPGCSTEEIRKAWRAKSVLFHPDAGGTTEGMIKLNAALELALLWDPLRENKEEPTSEPARPATNIHRLRRDVSSFTVNVLPVECWQALEVVAALCGPTIQDDPPYHLEFLLHDSSLRGSHHGWCRCECVPEAGSTTVHLTVGSIQGQELPSIDEVRDFLVEQLNSIDWPT
jgi:hypothetical protein